MLDPCTVLPASELRGAAEFCWLAEATNVHPIGQAKRFYLSAIATLLIGRRKPVTWFTLRKLRPTISPPSRKQRGGFVVTLLTAIRR
jgi:hypothetical protein